MNAIHTSKFLFPLILTASLFAVACGKEKQGKFHPELTDVSTPRKGVLPYFKGRIMDPYWPKADKYPADLRGLRDFELTTHRGEKYQPANIKGKFTLVTFFYATCRGICPAITANMKRLSGKIKDQSDLRFVSITVDPERDNVAALTAYRKRHEIKQNNWTFLTGDRPQIELIAREQFAGEVQTREGKGTLIDFVHTENVFLLDKQGYLRGIYRARGGMGDLTRLQKELGTLRARAARKKS